jgi:hypothetical protein
MLASIAAAAEKETPSQKKLKKPKTKKRGKKVFCTDNNFGKNNL